MQGQECPYSPVGLVQKDTTAQVVRKQRVRQELGLMVRQLQQIVQQLFVEMDTTVLELAHDYLVRQVNGYLQDQELLYHHVQLLIV